MEAEQHAAEQPTDHGINKNRTQNMQKKTDENENTTTPNLWDTVKAVLRGRVHSNTGIPQETRKKPNK